METSTEKPELVVAQKLEIDKNEKEIGNLAVWSVSTAKPGNGVDLLVDGREDTYWQSDGGQPHIITLNFQQKVRISKIAIQAEFRLDESYTPHKIAVRAGTRWSDVRVLRADEVVEPHGWIVIPLCLNPKNTKKENEEKKNPGGYGYLSALILQVLILSNHQNGRDTHVRQVKVFGPREDIFSRTQSGLPFRTPESRMYATVR